MSDHDKLREAIKWASGLRNPRTEVGAHIDALITAAESTFTKTSESERFDGARVSAIDECMTTVRADMKDFSGIAESKLSVELALISCLAALEKLKPRARLRVTGPHNQEAPS